MDRSKMHGVTITYKPDSGSDLDNTEQLFFSSEIAAKEFVRRQTSIPNVVNARYMGNTRGVK